MSNDHPPCLMHKCRNYPCRILDEIADRQVLCNEKDFWEKYGKKGAEK